VKWQGTDEVIDLGAKKLSIFIKYFRTTNSKIMKQTENVVRIEVKIVFKIFVGMFRREHNTYKTKVSEQV
jgi:hypothetical protein